VVCNELADLMGTIAFFDRMNCIKAVIQNTTDNNMKTMARLAAIVEKKKERSNGTIF